MLAFRGDKGIRCGEVGEEKNLDSDAVEEPEGWRSNMFERGGKL